MVNGKQHSVWLVPTGMKGLPQNVLLNFRLEFPKSDLTIYLPSGISEILFQMVSTPGEDNKKYRKIPKISSGAYFFSNALFEGPYYWRRIYSEGLIYRGKFAFQSFIVGRKFTVFVLFYFVFEGNFQVQATGGLIFGGAVQRRVFFALPVWRAYIWRGLFSEFYGNLLGRRKI